MTSLAGFIAALAGEELVEINPVKASETNAIEVILAFSDLANDISGSVNEYCSFILFSKVNNIHFSEWHTLDS
jgi:hypothetical protein